MKKVYTIVESLLCLFIFCGSVNAQGWSNTHNLSIILAADSGLHFPTANLLTIYQDTNTHGPFSWTISSQQGAINTFLRNDGAGHLTWRAIFPDSTGNSGKFLRVTPGGGYDWATASGGSGTVTSIDVSGGSTGLSFTGGPITTSGTITMGGLLTVPYGGTGFGTANANGVVIGNGASTLQVTSAGIDGQVFTGHTGAPPDWQNPTAALDAVITDPSSSLRNFITAMFDSVIGLTVNHAGTNSSDIQRWDVDSVRVARITSNGSFASTQDVTAAGSLTSVAGNLNLGNGTLTFPGFGVRTWNLQDADGTLAFLTDIPSDTGFLRRYPSTNAQNTITPDSNIIGATFINPDDATLFMRFKSASGVQLVTFGPTGNISAQSLTANTGLQISSFTAGVGLFDGSGNLTSGQVDLTSDVTGTLPIGNGGTGNTVYNPYGIIFADATGSSQLATFLALGSSGQILQSQGASSYPTWISKLNETQGGTNQSTWTKGDILYASATNTLSKSAIGATGNVLTVAAGLPVWAADVGSGGTVTSVAPGTGLNSSPNPIVATGTINANLDLEAYHSADNVFVGPSSGNSSLTGVSLTAIGRNTLLANTSGNGNTAVGWSALTADTSGGNNTAVGVSALAANLSGTQNNAFGGGALMANTTGSENEGVGYTALVNNTTGGNNTAVGHNSLATNTTGSDNTGIGFQANVTSGNLTNATAIGYNSVVLASNTIQLGNTSVTSVNTSATITAAGFSGPLTGNVTGNVTGNTSGTAANVTGVVALANGGTNANLTASNGGIFYSTGSAGAILSGTATANKLLVSGASGAPSWSTPTFPNASATSGKIIKSDGTNWVASTETYAAPGSSGNILTSDGTNWTSVTPTAGGGFTATLNDLNNVWTIKDTNIGATTIAATSKPGSPQFTYKVLGADIPSNANVTDYEVYFAIYGKDVNVSLTEPMNWRFTLNGTDIGTADNTLSPTVSNPYWIAMGRFETNAIAALDVLGIKLWVTNANQVNYIGATFYIVPRTYASAANAAYLYTTSGTWVSGALAGALSGVSYTNAASVVSAAALDPTLGIGATTGLINYPLSLVQTATRIDNNNVTGNGNTTNAAATLYELSSVHRYVRKWTYP